MVTFFEAMAETTKTAKKYGRACYLYKTSHYWCSFQYWDDWLFRAYPGGRKVLSVTGKAMADKTHAGEIAEAAGAE
jgi:hypothetical protein